MTTITSTTTELAVDAMSSAELLAGLEGLAPPEERARDVEKDTGLTELLKTTGPDTNVVVNGKLVQGKFTAYMARVMEWKARFDAMPADTTEEQWDALGAKMRADLESIETSPPKSPWDDPAFSLTR